MAFGNIGNGTVIELTSEQLQDIIHETLLEAHPIGSIYQSMDSTDPSILFGGTWERIEGKFIMGASDTYPAGSTGGSPTHTHDVSGDAAIGVMQTTTAYSSTGSKLFEKFPFELYAHTHERDYIFDNGNRFYSELRCVKTKGNANEQSNMPPYIAVYIWRRVA